jgi:serine protease Do
MKMLSEFKQSLQTKQIRIKTLAIIAAGCFAVGLAFPSGWQWLQPGKPAVAETLPVPAPVALSTSSSTPESFADVAQKLRPTVVNVKVVKKVKNADFSRPEIPEGPMQDFFERFFNQMPMPQTPQPPRTQQGMGSGVIISSDGYVLTNNHVVEGADEVTITLADQKEYKGRIVGRDPQTDLAVLKIDAKESFPASALGDSDNLKVGDWVVAIGNPFGLDHTVTAGIVSAKGRVIGAGPYDNFIQTDASINPGNSGGPLLNMRGEVVGINTAIIPQGQGIGFAIPVNTIKPLIPQLETKGSVTRGFLGVNIQSLTPALAKSLNLPDQKGALVADVSDNTPAAKAGIKRGDVIVSFNGKDVVDSQSLPAMVAATPVDQQATVTVSRNGEKLRLPIKIGELPSQRAENNQPAPSVQPAREKWGLQLRDLNPQIANQLRLKSDQGVVVVGVQPGSRAAESGVRQGDVILEVNRQAVSSMADMMARLKDSKEKDQLLLLVQRQNGKLFIPLLEDIS